MKDKSTKYNISSEFGKLPPQAVDVEEAVIGALILESEAYSKVSLIINYRSFYKEEHQKIFNRIKELSDKGVPVDLMQVVRALKDNDEFDEIGGPMRIKELTDRVSSAGHIEHWANIIQQKFIQRELIRISAEIQISAYDDTLDVSEIIASASEKIAELFTTPNTSIKNSADLVKEMYARIERNYRLENNITGFATGIQKLDKHTGGFQKTDLTILAAETGQGKTSLAVTITNNTTGFGNPVGFLSIEMPGVQLIIKITSQETGISSGDIYKTKLSDENIGLIESKVKDIGEKLLYVDDTIQSLDSVLSSIRYLHYKYKIELFFLDYIQLVTVESSSREEGMAKISRALKNLAKEIDISIVAISQLRRDTGSKINHRPSIDRLHGSAQIEQAADNIILIWRPEEYEIDYFDEDQYMPTEGKAMIDFAKGRNIGPTSFVIRFKKEIGLFYEERPLSDIPSDPDAFTEGGKSDIPF